MKKSIFIILVFAIIAMFTLNIYAETIMINKDNTINCVDFPDLADYSLQEKSDEAANSSDTQLTPAIWPFSRKNEIGSSRMKPKSTRKAFFLSLLLPGLGETYVGSKRNLIFFGIEALSWWMYISNTNDGKDLKDKFEGFADQYWTYYYEDPQNPGVPIDTNNYSYWEWLKRKYEINEFSSGLDKMEPDDYYKPTDYAEINEHIKNNQKEGSVHNLPSTETQQYHEMIGKYDQFVYGWEDIDHVSLFNENGEPTGNYKEDTSKIKSPLRIKYMDIRGDSNDKLSAGQRGVQLMIINRIVSAIDAARLAYHHNKSMDSDLSMVRIKFVQKHIIDHKVPMLMFTKKF